MGGSGLTGKNAKTEDVVMTTLSKMPSFVFIQLVSTQLTKEKNSKRFPMNVSVDWPLSGMCQNRVCLEVQTFCEGL